MLTYYNNYVPLVQLKTINMPRQARKTSGTGIYHVMLRGINRQDIFEDDDDYMKFLQSLHQLVECYDERGYRVPSLCHFYAYCLMPNHVHLLIQEKTVAIGEIVKRITISYANRSGDGSLIYSDGLIRDTRPRKSYDQALMDGIKQALTLLS